MTILTAWSLYLCMFTTMYETRSPTELHFRYIVVCRVVITEVFNSFYLFLCTTPSVRSIKLVALPTHDWNVLYRVRIVDLTSASNHSVLAIPVKIKCYYCKSIYSEIRRLLSVYLYGRYTCGVSVAFTNANVFAQREFAFLVL